MVHTSYPASPALRHLGTDATIKSYRTVSDKELIPPEGSEVIEARSTLPATVPYLALEDTERQPGNNPGQAFWQMDDNELSPAALDMLDFFRGDDLDQRNGPDLFDLNMWLDLNNPEEGS